MGLLLRTFRYLTAFRQPLATVFIPLVLSPLAVAFNDNPQLKAPMRCAYVLTVMIFYWITECLPFAVTAVVPMIAYPLLGIVPAAKLGPKYMEDNTIAFIGSILVISAFERAGLHKRFALAVLIRVGFRPRRLLFGFMFVSWFLSIGMANTMTTAVLLPIVLSVTAELQNAIRESCSATRLSLLVTMPPTPKVELDGEAVVINENSDDKDETKFEVLTRRYESMLLLAVAYCSGIGGMTTIIGSAANFIVKQQIDVAFTSVGCPSPLNFVTWMLFCLPSSAVMLPIAWLWLLSIFCGPSYAFGCRNSPLEQHDARLLKIVRELHNSLPPMKFRQWIVLAQCSLMVFLLVTRQLVQNPLIGWEIIAPGYVRESTATLFVTLIVFFCPISLPKFDPSTGKLIKPVKMALDWKHAERSFPFGIVLLIGGGMAAAYGAEVSGLAKLLADLLAKMTAQLDDNVAVLIMMLFVAFVTEVMSNPACVTLSMPILRQLAATRHSNPLFYMLPNGVSASFSFMLPISCPPNAIVFSSGKLTVRDMLKAGFGLKIIGIGILYLSTLTIGSAYFRFDEVPWTFLNDSSGNFTDGVVTNDYQSVLVRCN